MIKLPTYRPSPATAILWAVVLLLFALVVALAFLLPQDKPPAEVPEEKASSVRVETVARRPVEDRIELPGRLEPEHRIRLATDKAGRITELLADKGELVEPGQLLLRLDDRLWRAQAEEAAVERREADRDLVRREELMRSGAVSAGELDVVRARAELARIRQEQAAVHLSQGEVRSPVRGVINDRYVELGEFAAEGAAVFEILVTDPIRLHIQVPERDIGALRPGAPIAFSVAALGDGVIHTARVSHVPAAAAPPGNRFRTEAVLPNPNGRFRGGMIASVTLLRESAGDALAIPLAAVIPRKGEHVVFIAAGDRAQRRIVQIDRIVDSLAVLAGGLEPGEELIVKGHRALVDGARIRRVSQTD